MVKIARFFRDLLASGRALHRPQLLPAYMPVPSGRIRWSKK